jgi:hypothetical protein
LLASIRRRVAKKAVSLAKLLGSAWLFTEDKPTAMENRSSVLVLQHVGVGHVQHHLAHDRHHRGGRPEPAHDQHAISRPSAGLSATVPAASGRECRLDGWVRSRSMSWMSFRK